MEDTILQLAKKGRLFSVYLSEPAKLFATKRFELSFNQELRQTVVGLGLGGQGKTKNGAL